MKLPNLKPFLFLSLATLTACDIQPIKPGEEATGPVKPPSEKQLVLADQAEHYLALAEDSSNESEQFQYRAQAAHYFIEAGNIKLAQEQLLILKDKQKNRPASDKTQAKTENAAILLLSAKIAIAEKNVPLAAKLSRQIKPISAQQKIAFYEIKADLAYLSNSYMQAVEHRVELDKQLSDDQEKLKNHRKIWAALSNLPTATLKKQKSKDVTIKGWLELVKVLRSGQQNISQLENDLLDWGTRHPSHPVNKAFLSELIDDYKVDVTGKKHIAVILPMRGKLSKVSSNIKNGLLSAYYNDKKSPTKPLIKFYDSSKQDLSFDDLYQQALDTGATNIIGPVNKVTINQLAQQSELEVPVLTLNYAENPFNQTENLYQFGLSPEDEARQVAELAITQNKKRAAVFFPDSDWGQRLKKAFSEHYASLGGRVLTASSYATNTNDYRQPIRQLFNLDQSNIRRKKIENTISAKTQSEPYRRQDIDMIFLAATPRAARGIMPAFKFHHAGNLPVYSTSHVFTGKVNRLRDGDLNGLIFCDLPWVLQNTSPLAKVFSTNWPKQQSYTRLFALGVDAYHLINNIAYLEDKEYAFYTGQTGNIQLDHSNRVTRKLLWAKFKKGQPVYFEPVISTHSNASR